jgi:hypothetical protein
MISPGRITVLALSCMLFLGAAAAHAQSPAAPGAVASAAEPDPGFFTNVSRWFDRQTSGFLAGWQTMTSQVRNFSREASAAAQVGAQGAKDAAVAAAGLRNARVVTGYERCGVAANGAPDCLPAVVKLCRSQGLKTGTSLEMTAAEDCPTKVYLAGRSSGPECTSFTFVSRALCQ